MSHPLEPDNVGPIAGGHLRIGDVDRQQAREMIDQAYTAGRLSAGEHRARLAEVEQARIFDDLFPLTRDLDGPRPSLRPSSDVVHVGNYDLVSQRHGMVRTTGIVGGGDKTMVAVFGGFDRRPAMLREQTSVLTIFGGGELDLRDAVFENNVCKVSVVCAFGGLEVIVPPGVRVLNKTLPIFGGTSTKSVDPTSAPDAPTIVLTGVCAFGGVEVKTKRRN